MKAAEYGRIGEKKAAAYLKTLGYIIIKRNWRDSRYGEIDIVAESKTEIVFAEVRTRSADALLSGFESIDSRKLARVKNAATQFMKRFKTNLPYRVDAIELTYYNDENSVEKWQLKHLKGV